MKYQVIWLSIAEDELAAVWLAAADRQVVTAAAAWLDAQLTRAPLALGHAGDSSVHRLAYRHPIGIEFEVIEDDKRVFVQGVFDAT